jgi:hypothetical protein
MREKKECLVWVLKRKWSMCLSCNGTCVTNLKKNVYMYLRWIGTHVKQQLRHIERMTSWMTYYGRVFKRSLGFSIMSF